MDMKNLYRQVIMEHHKNPLNKGLVDDENYELVHLNNPSCGDDIKVQVKIENNIITDIRHDGQGCSICCSSGSVMSDVLKNLKVDEVLILINDFYKLLTGNNPNNPNLKEAVVFEGVSLFPARVRCATLAWKALEQAIINIKSKENL